ncbi:uncharacterized protein [Malus domestica]|uniref:uncharacterized protein n=1 Tax=Malus domestica TaxID=3750 RepID=UPI003974A33D
MVEDVIMPANLMPLDIVDFDVILGTNWLHYNRAKIDCYGKTVTFHRPGLPEVTFVGEPSGVRHVVISAMKAKRLLSKGCQGYLAHVVLNNDALSSVEDVRVVRHFPDVFLDDLPGLPPDRDVEFVFYLLPDLRSTGVELGVEDQEEALLTNFQVRPILIDRVLEAQMNDEETQEIIQARNQGRKKDFRIRETDGMLM